jgi:peroxiredoxin
MKTFLVGVTALAIVLGAATAQSETAVDVEPLNMEEFTRIADGTTIALDANVRASLAELVAAVPEEQHRQFQPGVRERLVDVNSELTLKDVSSVLMLDDATPVLAMLGDHDDPVLRFTVNATLAGRGDSGAAAAVYDVLHSEAPTHEQKRVLATWAAGIGLHPATDTPETIAQHMSSMMSGEPKIKAGEPAPDFEVKDVEGKTLKLKELRGRTVLLHFWTTSCGPCIAGFPMLKERLAAFPESDLVVIAVSIDESGDREKAMEAIRDHALPWHNVLDGGGWGGTLARAYGVNRLPLDIVIDVQGVVRSYETGDLAKVIADGKSNKATGVIRAK